MWALTAVNSFVYFLVGCDVWSQQMAAEWGSVQTGAAAQTAPSLYRFWEWFTYDSTATKLFVCFFILPVYPLTSVKPLFLFDSGNVEANMYIIGADKDTTAVWETGL